MKRTPPPSTGLTISQLEEQLTGSINAHPYRDHEAADWEVLGWFITPHWYTPSGVVKFLCRNDEGRIIEAWVSPYLENEHQKMLVAFGEHLYELAADSAPPQKEPFAYLLIGAVYDLDSR